MLIMINVDDISGEVVPFVIDGALERGAINVHVVQALTKKGRPEYLFFVEVENSNFESVSAFLYSQLGSLGMKIFETKHLNLNYETELVKVNIKGNSINEYVSVKISKNKKGKILSVSAEFEDVARLVKSLASKYPNTSLRNIIRIIETSVLKGEMEIDIHHFI